MTASSHLISVIIPTFNRAQCLETAVKSVLAQTFPDYELIVVDDGSTDNTPQVVQPYLDRITYLICEHRGKSAALNSALAACKGVWVAILDSDDEWLPRKLERQVETLQQYPECGVCFTDVITKGDPEIVGSAFVRRGKHFNGKSGILADPVDYVLNAPHAVYIQSTLVRRELFAKTGSFNEALAAEDMDMMFRLALETGFAYVNEPLVVIDRTPKRGDSIVELLERSMEVELGYKQAVYEGWLAISHRLPTDVPDSIERKLAAVHDGWSNYYMFAEQWDNAMTALRTANRTKFLARRLLKMASLRLFPRATAAVMRRRCETRFLRNAQLFKRGKANLPIAGLAKRPINGR